MKKNYFSLKTLFLSVCLAIMCLLGTNAQVTYLPDPVAYWPMDDGGVGDSTAIDVVGDAHGEWNTIGAAGLSWEAGKFGNAATLGGSATHNFHVSTDPLIDAEEMTISAWINADALKAQAGIITTRGNQYQALTQEGTHIDYRVVGAGGMDSPEDLLIDTWYHVAFTWKESGLTYCYLNGEKVVTNTLTSAYISNGQWEIGLDDCCGGIRSFQGQLDDIAMFNIALTPEEIKYIYDEGELGNAVGDLRKPVTYLPDPVAYWPMNDGGVGDSTAIDVVGDAHGTWNTTGAVGLTWEAGKFGNAATLGGGATHNFHVATDPLEDAEEMTISAWMKADALKAQAGIITTRGSQYQALTQEGTHIDYRVHGVGGMDSPEDLVIDTWYHVALTRDIDGLTNCYLNGEKVVANTIATDYISNGQWEIGLDDCCGGIRSFQGSLDEISMFNIALSPEEIKFMYDQGELGNTVVDLKKPVTFLPYPVAYWPMDDGGVGDSTAIDVVGDAHGEWKTTGAAGLTWEAGKLGSAATLSGSATHNFHVSTDPLVDAEEMTISAWMNADALKAQAGIVTTRGSQYQALTQEGTHIDYRVHGVGGMDSPEDLLIDTWYHVAITKDTAGLTNCFLNGEKVFTNTIATDYISNGQWEIGLDDCCGGIRSFQGSLDDIAMFNTALSPEAIKFMYDQGELGNAIGDLYEPAVPSPVAYWPLNETSDSITYDQINGAHGGWNTIGEAGLTWEAGKIGNAATLGGSATHNFHVSTDPLVNADEMTISAWMNADALKAQAGIITTRGSQYQALTQEGTHIDYRVHGVGGMDSPEDLLIDTWYHVAITKDPAGLTNCYLNGEKVFTNTIASAYISNGQWEIGLDDCCGGIRSFQGQLDEIAMFDQALSPFQIKLMYENGNLGIPITQYLSEEALSDKAFIKSFSIQNQVEDAVIGDDDTIRVTVLANEVTSLTSEATISDRATISPDPTVAADYTSPVNFTVTAEDGSMKVYSVKVTQIIPDKNADILSFSFDGVAEQETVIDEDNQLITVTVGRWTDVSALKPLIAISPLARSVSPESEIVQDFTDTLTYVVTAEDTEVTKEYKVAVTFYWRTKTIIDDFAFEGLQSEVVIAAYEIRVEVPYGTDLSSLTPNITVGEGGTVSPESGIAQNFSDDFVYTVTAEDDINTREYAIKVSYLPNTEALLKTFVLTEQTGEAVFSTTNDSVDIEVVAGTDVTALTPVITVSDGATVVPASGVEQDFSSMQLYTVTAEDGTTASYYFVTVSVAPTSAISNVFATDNMLYPNPANQFVNIDSNVELIKIYNLSGALLVEEQNTNTVDISGLNKGIYMVKIYSKGMEFRNKLIVE